MIYENVKSLADKKKLSISEIEEKAELGNGTIGKWRTFKPNLANLEKVANVLGVPVTRLLK